MDLILNNAPINVKPAIGGGGGWGREGGRAWGGDLTLFKNLPSNSLPTGKSSRSNATKFPNPGLHIAFKCPKVGPKKGTSFLIYKRLLHHQRYMFLFMLQLRLYVLTIQSVLHCVEYRNLQEEVHIL